jgi:hypothetical protein
LSNKFNIIYNNVEFFLGKYPLMKAAIKALKSNQKLEDVIKKVNSIETTSLSTTLTTKLQSKVEKLKKSIDPGM